MGTVHYQSMGPVSDIGGTYQSETFLSAKSKGPVLSGVAIWPMGDHISLDARGGAFFGKTRLRASAYIDGFYLGDASEKDNSTTFVLGAGVNWAMSPGMAIRAGYSRISKAMVSEYDVGSWMLGLKYAW
jgi:opacity protein-like surface antigen